MIEENAVGCMHAISLAVVDNNPVRIQLSHPLTRESERGREREETEEREQRERGV